MIRFQALMQAVQQSIHSAAQEVEKAGSKHINKFFDRVVSENNGDKEEISKELSEAINSGDNAKATELLKKFNDSSTDDDLVSDESATYRPKMVAMAFPNQGADGVESTIVNVPLITLCPISSPRIKDVKFSADLEVTTDNNNELYVAFRPPQVKGGENTVTKDTTNTHIEISLVGHEPPEGLQKVVEGYEKALRAQIPG